MSKKIQNLEWQMEMGANEAIEATPQNRIKNAAAKKNAAISAKKVANSQQKTSLQSPHSMKLNTRNIAESCNTVSELRKAVENFKELSISKTATNTVFADGNPEADVMLVGEAPGAEEDAQGIPFCGASGQLLNQMLSYIGLTREKNFYITNTVFWRPPGNRRPTPEELATCLPFVEKHIALVKPKLIILVGGTAISSLLETNEGITKMRGNFYDYTNCYISDPIKTTAIFHPSYLLRSPGQKKWAWKDLLMIQEHIEK